MHFDAGDECVKDGRKEGKRDASERAEQGARQVNEKRAQRKNET